VSFAAVVNGTSLTTDGFSLSDLLDPGDTNKDLRFDVGQDHRIIDLEYYGVPKFSANQHFTLTATLTGPGGSGAGTAEVDILLPVVLLHGWMGDSAVADFLRIIPSLMAGLADEGYTTDDTWYQTLWYQKYRSTRVSPDEVTSWLDGIVTQATGATYAERVNIVAHSLGGLVGRYYVSAGPGAEKVHKLIMIGTPNKGVSLFYLDSSRKSLEWVNRRLDSSPLLWWTIPAYPAVYQEVAGVPVHVEPPLANTFPGGTGGVACYSIYATGHLETAGGLLVTPYKDWFKVEDGGLFPGHGDGLVLAESAQLDGADNRPLASSTDHVFLPGDPAVQSHVLQCLHD
jgi:triacylglycerol esterase/lipase EstA (alpha/beta hydrolase family)